MFRTFPFTSVRNFALRLAQIICGLGYVYVTTKLLLPPLQGESKRIAAILSLWLLGYLFVWSNTYILKRPGNMTPFEALRPSNWGHLVLALGALFAGLGIFSHNKPMIWIGIAMIYFADYVFNNTDKSPLMQAMREVEQEREKLRIKDIEVTVTACPNAPEHFLLTIKNRGEAAYKNLRVLYEPLLLDANSFGVDTTHMPDSRIPGEPIQIEKLMPKQSVQFVRKGWGKASDYDGPKQNSLPLQFCSTGSPNQNASHPWCFIKLKLPNAKSN